MRIVARVLSTVKRNMSKKIVYSAPERNKSVILDVLKKEFDDKINANVLEISSGTGQHVAYFAEHYPNYTFYPSEYDASLLDSIREYAEETPTKNVKEPLLIDVTREWTTWDGLDQYDYIININMIHITPLICSKRLFENASGILKPGGLMITYGPYGHNGIIRPKSNVDFNESLQTRNHLWGIRDICDLQMYAEENNMKLVNVYDVPANNKCLVWFKKIPESPSPPHHYQYN